MGLWDRIAGKSKKDTYAGVNIFLFEGVTGGHVSWEDHKLSPYAEEIGPSLFGANRQFMFDRMYLAVMFYGSILRQLKAIPKIQSELFAWVSLIGEHLKEKDTGCEEIQMPMKEIVDFLDLQITFHCRSVLYQGPTGNIINKEYMIKNDLGTVNARSPLHAIVSLIGQCNEPEMLFFANWLLGTKSFYEQYTPNSMSSEIAATTYAMNYAVSRVTAEQAAIWGIDVPDILRDL